MSVRVKTEFQFSVQNYLKKNILCQKLLISKINFCSNFPICGGRGMCVGMAPGPGHEPCTVGGILV